LPRSFPGDSPSAFPRTCHRRTARRHRKGSRKCLNLTGAVPAPSRRTRDGVASTKPARIFGGGFCRGRPFFGRAAICSIQVDSKPCPLRPEVHGTERPLQNRRALLVVGFVEAARFLGGQPFVPSRPNLSHDTVVPPIASAGSLCYFRDLKGVHHVG